MVHPNTRHRVPQSYLPNNNNNMKISNTQVQHTGTIAPLLSGLVATLSVANSVMLLSEYSLRWQRKRGGQMKPKASSVVQPIVQIPKRSKPSNTAPPPRPSRPSSITAVARVHPLIRAFKHMVDDLEIVLRGCAKKVTEEPFEQQQPDKSPPDAKYRLGNHPAFRGIGRGGVYGERRGGEEYVYDEAKGKAEAAAARKEQEAIVIKVSSHEGQKWI